jgi:hypothetical protein
METFINIQQEFPIYHPDRNEFIYKNIANVSIMRKIEIRKEKEQFASVTLLQYNKICGKRKRKSTFWKNGKFNFIN